MLPDLPTVADALPGFEFTSWYGVLMPAATPRPLVLRVNEEINRVLSQAEVKAYLEKQAMVPLGGAPETFTARIKRESARWAKVVKDTGARVE